MVVVLVALPLTLLRRFGAMSLRCGHLHYVYSPPGYGDEVAPLIVDISQRNATAAGCVRAVQPEFYRYPAEAEAFHLLVLLQGAGFVLSPHILLHCCSGSGGASTRSIRWVLGTILVAGSVAVLPSTYGGLVWVAWAAVKLMAHMMTSNPCAHMISAIHKDKLFRTIDQSVHVLGENPILNQMKNDINTH